METNEIIPLFLVLMLTGFLVGIGIVVFHNFGVAARDTVVSNQSVTQAAGSVTLTGIDEIVTIYYYGNSTNNYPANTSLVLGSNINWTGTTITTDLGDSATYRANVSAKLNSTASDTMQEMIDATSPITTTWLSLVIVVSMLGIVLGLVIRSFAMSNR